jgi:phage replication-related protein YjqB (UPF0714/DUF867 family)
MDRYRNYEDLKKNEVLGADFEIRVRKGPSTIAFMAPHGGGIEPGTAEIADRAAGNEHTFYAFIGLKKRDNHLLHIGSRHFDEPIALKTAREADTVVAVHGCRGPEDTVYVGGLNTDLMTEIKNKLIEAGFSTEYIKEPSLRGRHPKNICNQCRSGQGIQLELPRGLREKMLENLNIRSGRRKNPLFLKFIKVLRETFKNGQSI